MPTRENNNAPDAGPASDIAHHDRPSLPWYQLKAYYAQERAALLKKNNNYLMHGYGEIFRRYFFKPKETVQHPNIAWLKQGNA